MLAAWDAEEWGLVGSAEWAEEHVAALVDGAVAYVNLDGIAGGPYFHAMASPSLARAVREAAAVVPDPLVASWSVLDGWAQRSGSGAGSEPPVALLHGPPGCGKTMLAHAIAGELGVPFFKISAPEIVAGTSGESEQKIRDLFAQARAAAPAILFIDEVDAITPKRENAQREMEKRIVAQLLVSMDELGGGGSRRRISV